MPMKAPRICACGYRIASGQRCPCEARRKAAADARRPSARERGYDTKWDKERAAFLKVNRTCVRCGAPAKVVDHITPHRGDQNLFWSRSNWQPLCCTCHVRWKQSVEKREAAHG